MLTTQSTGMIRRIDDLGRVVIPKEVRKLLGVEAGDPVEISVEPDGTVTLRKYEAEERI